jgi:preprotein translocase subunit SecF
MFHFDYFGKRRWFFLLSFVLLLTGLVFALVFGVKLDIQFKGGSILKYAHTTSIDLEKASGVAAKTVGVEVSAQEVKDNKTGDLNLVLNMAGDQALTVDQMSGTRRSRWPSRTRSTPSSAANT